MIFMVVNRWYFGSSSTRSDKMKADAEDIFTSDFTNNVFAKGQKGDLPSFETTGHILEGRSKQGYMYQWYQCPPKTLIK